MPSLLLSMCFLSVVLAGCAGNVSRGTGATVGTGSVQTDNYANYTLEYYYYIPSSLLDGDAESHSLIVAVPGLSGRGEYFVPQGMKDFAEENGYAIVAPSFQFDERNWDSQQSYQYPWVWSGDALIAIVEQVEFDNAIAFSDWYLFGFSAGAQFSLRFCVWQPALCAACAAHGSGGTVIPEEYVDVAFLVTVGSQDTSRIAKAQAFYYAASALGIDVMYKEYPVGHQLSDEQIGDSLDFFSEVR